MKIPPTLPLLVASTMFMEQLDGTILVTALPSIAGSFGGSAASLDLSVSAYLVTLSFMIPASGWIADRLGAKRVLAAPLPCLSSHRFCAAPARMPGSSSAPEFFRVSAAP